MTVGRTTVFVLSFVAIMLGGACTAAIPPSTTPPIPRSSAAQPTPSAAAEVHGTELWRGDFDTGDTSQYDVEAAKDYSITVQDGGPGHPTAGRFEVRDGDTPVDTGERAEAKPPNFTDVSEGDERWYSFSIMFDKSFTVSQRFCIPMQWHPANADGTAAEGDPPLSLQCGPGDKLNLNLHDETFIPIGTLDRGVWHSYLLHVKFSQDPRVAFYEVSRDGKPVVPKTSPKKPNLVGPRLYTKIGIYRHPINTSTQIVWFDDVIISGP